MKKVLSLMLCCSLICVLSGCNAKIADIDFRDTEGYDLENGFAVSLTSCYKDFQKKYPEQENDICYYIMAQNQMPEERNVKFCFTNVYADGWREASAMEITSKGIELSDERMIYSFGKHFPVDTVVSMTGCSSVDDLFERVGQVQTYGEFGDICAFTVSHLYDSSEYVETVYYGSPDDPHFVDVHFGELTQQPEQSLQLTEENIYYFVYNFEDLNNSYITVVQIPLDGGEVITRKIFYSDIGLPSLLNRDFSGNIFVDGDYLFFLGGFTLSVETLEAELDVVAYNLNTNEYDVYRMQNIDGVGKIFRCGERLGVTTALFDEQGYYSSLAVRYFNFDTAECALTEDNTLSLPLSAEWSYSFEKGKDFYCIDDTLCGIMTEKRNGASYAYVEVDLKSGAVTTFIPFAKNTKQTSKGLFYGTILIRDNGRAVSEHNCY